MIKEASSFRETGYERTITANILTESLEGGGEWFWQMHAKKQRSNR